MARTRSLSLLWSAVAILAGLGTVSAVAAAPHSRTPRGAYAVERRLVTADFPLTYVAAVCGVSPHLIRLDLKHGRTLLQIAAHAFHSAPPFAAALLTGVAKKLRQEVTQGRLSRAQEHREYAALLRRTRQLVTTRHPTLVWLPRYRAMGLLVTVRVR